MTELDALQQALIAQLSGGLWTSGASIAEKLGLSREAVSKRVRKLEELGLQVESQTGRGYKLSQALELLDARTIEAALAQHCAVCVLPSIDSTNRWASQQTQTPLLCLAEHQHAGRGRRGRQWQSPFGQNLYLSLRWDLPRWPEKLPALSLALGVALAQHLRTLNIPIQLKWPNDLYLEGQKFAGMLIEQRGDANDTCTLVIGLGMNVSMQDNPAIDQQWTSLAREGYSVSRNTLAVEIAKTLIHELRHLSTSRLEQRLAEFEQFDVFHQREVVIQDGEQQIFGRAQGLDEWGRLQLKTAQGLEHFSVGDVSLRAAAR